MRGLSILLLLGTNVMANTDCDQLYQSRLDLFQAVQCFEQAAMKADVLENYEKALIASSSIVSEFPKTEKEKKAIEQGLQIVEKLKAFNPDGAAYFYWRAVWVSFDVRVKDRGALLPRNTFRVLSQIQSDLKRARELEPSLHLFGPSRVLGILHTELPGIAGGDKKFAEELLREAYQSEPRLSSNRIAYAKILEINGKRSEAKSILETLLRATANELNPYTGRADADLRLPLFEIKMDQTEAKKLLEQILEDENSK